MHMRESVFCLLTAAVLGCADQTPGVHLDQVASGPVQAGFAIRIPASYADRALVDFPLVLLASPGGKPGFRGVADWAESEGVILVSLHVASANLPERLNPQFKAVLATVMADYRIEPALRFCADTHGFVNTEIAKNKDTVWGGFIYCGDVPWTKPATASVCMGFIPGPPREGWNSVAMQGGYVNTLASFGLPYRLTGIPEDAKTWDVTDDVRRLLDWMLLFQRLSHPTLSPAMKKAGQERLVQRVASLSAPPADVNQEKRLLDCDRLLDIELVAKSKHAAALRIAWCDAGMALAMAETEAIPKNRRLEFVSGDERCKAMPAAQRKIMQSAIAELRKDKTVRADTESRTALVAAHKLDQDRRSGRTKGKPDVLLRTSIMAFEDIRKRWPDSEAATAAANTISRLELELR